MSDFTALARLLTVRPLSRPIGAGPTRRSPFSASWSSTVSDLRRELTAHGAENCVLEVDFRESDLRIDGPPRSGRQPRSPAVALSFRATKVAGKPNLRYEVATFSQWTENLRAIALGLNALRAVDRYGVTKRGEQYAGWKALTAGAGNGDGDPARGRELIAAAGGLSRALHRAHPDHGGSEQDFKDVIAARDAARNSA